MRRSINVPCFSETWSADLLIESEFLVLVYSAWINLPIWGNIFRWVFWIPLVSGTIFFLHLSISTSSKPWERKKKKTIRIWKHKRSFLKCSTVFHFNDIQKYSECITADQCRKDVWNATENRTYLYARCTNMLKYVVKYAVGVK